MESAEKFTYWSTNPLPLHSKTEAFWLFASGSLTSKLQALGTYSLDLISQSECKADVHDAQSLNLPVGSEIWVREVLMYIDNQPCVAARSLASINSLQHDWRELARYGRFPLGDILYNDPTVERSPFECALLISEDPLERLSRMFDHGESQLSARRSEFRRNNSTLCVCECFLSAFWSNYAGDADALLLKANSQGYC